MARGGLTRDEQVRAIQQLRRWPKAAGRELLFMERNEVDLIMLAAAELEAMPEEGWPSDRRGYTARSREGGTDEDEARVSDHRR